MSENQAHSTTGPLAVQANGNIPAGWVSAENHEAQQRQLHREAIAREMEEAAKAAVEAEVDKRISAIREAKGSDVTDAE